MPSSMSHITTLTADYDAIERAIRETGRGRWFLACYLERNRSAETRMLLGAIAKLESAMRDNGHVLSDPAALETVAVLRELIDQARSDMAHLPRVDNSTAELPVSRFNFEGIPGAIAGEVQAIRDAAASIHSAAYALQAAGVFQGVARQIAERADAIEHACATQEAALTRATRMATLLSDIEAELMSSFEDAETFAAKFGEPVAEIRGIDGAYMSDRYIPDEVVEEISAALGDDDDDGFYGPSSA